MSDGADRDRLYTRDEIMAERAEVARLTAELAERTEERDDAKAKLHDEAMAHLVTMQERDGLAAAIQPESVEQYIRAIEWTDFATDLERSECNANIRRFAMVLREELNPAILAAVRARAKADALREAATQIESEWSETLVPDGMFKQVATVAAHFAKVIADRLREMAAQAEAGEDRAEGGKDHA